MPANVVELMRRLDPDRRRLARAAGRPDFVVADYFDFIGGTSTGAIIATCLSLGWSVDTLKMKYRRLGEVVFASVGSRPPGRGRSIRRAVLHRVASSPGPLSGLQAFQPKPETVLPGVSGDAAYRSKLISSLSFKTASTLEEGKEPCPSL